MEDLNYLPKLSDIRKLLNKWKPIKISPIERITVIRALIMPTLHNLLLTKPNRSIGYLNTFQNDNF